MNVTQFEGPKTGGPSKIKDVASDFWKYKYSRIPITRASSGEGNLVQDIKGSSYQG